MEISTRKTVTEKIKNLEKSFHSVSSIYFSISKLSRKKFVASLWSSLDGSAWRHTRFSPARYHLTIHHRNELFTAQNLFITFIGFCFTESSPTVSPNRINAWISVEINCLRLGGKWWLLFHLLQIILYNNWHITTLVDRNTIFYKALYKQLFEMCDGSERA